MLYRTLPAENAEKRAFGFRTMIQKFNCVMGNHEFGFKHEAMPRPHWVTNIRGWEPNMAWLTKTHGGLKYYQVTIFCPHCQTVFRDRNGSLKETRKRLGLEYYKMIEAWGDYVDDYLLR